MEQKTFGSKQKSLVQDIQTLQNPHRGVGTVSVIGEQTNDVQQYRQSIQGWLHWSEFL